MTINKLLIIYSVKSIMQCTKGLVNSYKMIFFLDRFSELM